MADTPLIKLDHIHKSYAIQDTKTTMLKDIHLSIRTGDMLAIVGTSGSGKSTLMNILGLLDKPDSGRYAVDDRLVSDLPPNEAARFRNQTFGFVFQQFNLLPRLTAHQNVALPLVYRHDSPKAIDEKVKTVLGKVGMERFEERQPAQLSGGQQQRIAIARALVGDPRIILADEPTGALDSQTGKEVMALFQALNHEGRTIIIVTHDPSIAQQCHRQITIQDGQISEALIH